MKSLPLLCLFAVAIEVIYSLENDVDTVEMLLSRVPTARVCRSV